jgi:tetratricopeptide (TPR) repeat protein
MIFGSLNQNMIKTLNMRQKIIYFSLLLTAVCILSGHAFSQKGVDDGSRFGHGEDSIRCLKNLSLYREYARQKLYNDALPFWRIVFAECPRASKNIYLDGVKIFRFLIEKEEDENIKSAYIDTMMLIYDQRIKYYGGKCNVRGRQGVDLLRYRRMADIKYIQQGYDYLKESMTLCKGKTSDAVLATLLSASITLCQNQNIDEKQLLDDYLAATDIINLKLKKDPGEKSLRELRENMDNSFTNKPLCSCDLLVEVFSKRMEEKPNDIDNLKTISTILKKSDCCSTDLFFLSSKNLHDSLPSAESAENIAIMAFTKNKYNEAVKYYNQAIQLENDDLKKAEYYLGLAKSKYKLNDLSEAKNLSMKAISYNNNWGEPYLLIGQIYADSKNSMSDECIPSAVYWLAVDKFIEAKKVDATIANEANKLILTYTKYFPNKEDAFFCGVNEGDTYTVGSWINESTIARF